MPLCNFEDGDNEVQLQPRQLNQLYENMTPTVVIVNDVNPKSQQVIVSGAGVVITEEGDVLTSSAIVKGASYIQVIHQNTSYEAKVLFSDIFMSVIRLENNQGVKFPYASIASTPLRNGYNAHFIGHPSGKAFSFGTGIVSNDDKLLGNTNLDFDDMKAYRMVEQTLSDEQVSDEQVSDEQVQYFLNNLHPHPESVQLSQYCGDGQKTQGAPAFDNKGMVVGIYVFSDAYDYVTTLDHVNEIISKVAGVGPTTEKHQCKKGSSSKSPQYADDFQ